MGRLLLNGAVALRSDHTKDGRRYEFAAINIAGKTFHADINGEHDEQTVRRIAKEAGKDVIDWRQE